MRKRILIATVSFLSIIPGHTQTIPQRIERLVDHYASEGLFNGSILVSQKGKVIFKKGVGYANMEWKIPNSTTTKFRLGSITKQFTSMLIMQLVNEGKIKLSDRIIDHLPHYRHETGERVTIHHLLTHSSGIPNYTEDRNFGRIFKTSFSVPDFIRLYCSGDLQFDPGSRFSYSNSGYFILGGIIEAITGKAYHIVLRERILDVLGMKNTGYDFYAELIPGRAAGYEKTVDGFRNADYLDMGLPYAAGSLYSTVEDLHIWDRALYTEKLLPDSLKKIMFGRHVEVKDMESGYAGYGWFSGKQKLPLTGSDLNMIWHNGGINGFLTTLNRFPDSEIFIAVLDNSSQSIAEDEMNRDILEILSGKNPPLPKPSLTAALHRSLVQGNVSQAVDKFQIMGADDLKKFQLNGAEAQINRWGYTLLRDKKNIGDAIRMFALNVKLFPHSSNVYDSYAEAQMLSGDHPNAIANYKKAYALDSTNKRALAMIDNMLPEQTQDTIRVTVDGHAVDLFVSGKQGPVLVLEAGGNSNHECWNSIVTELSEFARVVTYDRPGYLNSISCTKPRTAIRVAEELHEALKLAGIGGPYIIGGWSWGGAFAKVFAGKYPQETKGLLLVDPVSKEIYDQMAAQYPDAFTRIFNERIAANFAAQDEFDAMLPTMYQAAVSDKTYNGKTYLLIAGSDKEWAEFEKPLKMIWIDELVNWAGKRSNVKYEQVESGHYIQREKPDVVISALKDLMK